MVGHSWGMPSPVFEIRTFEESDTDEVIALWRAVFSYPAPHNQPERAIREKLARQRELFFVAVSELKVIGTVMAGYDGHRGWIYSLAVSAESRRHGIGTALVRHVEAELLALNCGKINLQILAHNEGVVEFYQRLGYAVEPRISMGKVLGRGDGS